MRYKRYTINNIKKKNKYYHNTATKKNEVEKDHLIYSSNMCCWEMGDLSL